MRIAIDHSPLVSEHKIAHKIRGTGFYTKNLINALNKFHPEHEYVLFTQGDNLKGIDLFHYPYFDPFFITLPVFKKGKTIITIHDLTPIVLPKLFPAGIKGKLKYLIQKNIARKSDAIITDSISSKNDIQRLFNIKESKVFSVPLAASDEFVRLKQTEEEKEKMFKKFNLPKKFALYVGDATPNKNLRRLVDASISANIPLVMVGSALTKTDINRNNPWNQDLVYVQKVAQVNKNIFLLGYLSAEDLVSIYNVATLFVFPTLYEGFGLPLLEAASCGLPIISSSISSVPEVIGDAAYIIDPYSAESIEEGLLKVFKDDELQKSLSKRALTQAGKFSWKKTADETVKVYEEIYTKT